MSQISVRIDDDLKKNAERTLDDIGLSMSSAITIFLKTVVRENRIPFELSADPFYLSSNIKYLEKIKYDIDNGKASFSEHSLRRMIKKHLKESIYY